MDNKACKLEAEHEVKARIARLKRLAAEKATTTRAEVLAGISYTFQAGIARVGGAGDGGSWTTPRSTPSRSWARLCSMRCPKRGVFL